MNNIIKHPITELGYDFIDKAFLPKGKDEYYLRNKQNTAGIDYRQLTSSEKEILIRNGNSSDDWGKIFVSGIFDPVLVKNNKFFGLVRIGKLEAYYLEFHNLRMPVGIYNSTIISSDFGDNVCIDNANYLSHYIVGNEVMIANINELATTDYSKFGNGTLKEGEDESTRIWLEVRNENGGRKIIPFANMLPGDAWLGSTYPHDEKLQEKLKEFTAKETDHKRGYYGTIGDRCVLKDCDIIKDVVMGTDAYIKGANKLKNLTINSDAEQKSQIGEGCEMVNGIVGYGCRIFYGVKAVRFIMAPHSQLKYGARLINSYLGNNSTISCCEVLNTLIFPNHEQHHNNSFLVASVIMGQSNIAAGATIGSNHNSRANDSEIQAGRGFWPGLCTSLKHSCRFSSFVLLSKSDYPAEMDIPLPFSLVNNNISHDRLEVLPAYWWLYNMYALARNSWKFQIRDKRIHKDQNIEFEAFAPDTVEEIITARRLLEIWVAKADLRKKNIPVHTWSGEDELAKKGRSLLTRPVDEINKLEVLGENMENTQRETLILKPYSSYHAYGDMLHHYAIKNLLDYMTTQPEATFDSMSEELTGKREKEWINLGGQLMKRKDLDKLRKDIGAGRLKSWEAIHSRYNDLWDIYKIDKQKHAFATLTELYGDERLTKSEWDSALRKTIKIQEFIRDQVHISRNKDFTNQFKKVTFRNKDEMEAALGTIEENSFIVQVRDETEEMRLLVEEIAQRGKSIDNQ